MADPDWKLIETFVRVAETGSLTAAAELLGTSQPTASRNIHTLEDTIGTRLFVRHSRGLSLSDRGADLFAGAKALDEGVKSLFRRASGLGEVPKGTVRVSVNEPIGVHVLPDCFATLRRNYPEISIELVIDNRIANLSRREADIALRMFRPEQLDLVARRLGSVALGFFASRDYAERHGLPSDADSLSGHTLIGSDRDPSFPRAVAALGLRPEQFTFRTDSIIAQIEAIVRGVGIGGTQLGIAARYPNLVRVLPAIRIDPLEVWIVMHQDLRGDPAVRKVFDALSATMEAYAGESTGKGALPEDARGGRSRRSRQRLRGSGVRS
jgi:DNA-binding transcriptional LysR family regulator